MGYSFFRFFLTTEFAVFIIDIKRQEKVMDYAEDFGDWLPWERKKYFFQKTAKGDRTAVILYGYAFLECG